MRFMTIPTAESSIYCPSLVGSLYVKQFCITSEYIECYILQTPILLQLFFCCFCICMYGMNQFILLVFFPKVYFLPPKLLSG